MRGRMPAAVLFDCDGVLIDSEELAAEANRLAFAQCGVTLTKDDLRRRFLGMSMKTMKEHIARDFPGVDLERWSGCQIRLVNELFDARLVPQPGAAKLLEALQSRSIPFACASNSRTWRLARCLRTTGLDVWFGDRIWGADQVEHPKPAPDLYLLAARNLGVPPQECLVVEDSPSGVRAGAAAGARVVAVRAAWRGDLTDAVREAGASGIVGSLPEVLELL